MFYKQEPCPLCGMDMTAIETHPGRGELYCGHCDLTIGGNEAKTPEELIALMDGSEHRRLQAENAKLRELLSWMYDRMDESCAVQYPYAPAPISYDRLMQALARARELGVEVNDV